MLQIQVLIGIPASGKSTYAKQVIAKDPNNYVRVNNDDLRAMMNGSVWSSDYEKMITDARNYLIRNALQRGKNVIVDNLNINKRHWDAVCSIAKSVNADIQVFEKVFYCPLEEAIERDAKREGKACVGEQVIRKWWKESGKDSFKHYRPRVEIFPARRGNGTQTVAAPVYNPSLPTVVLCDLDGTLALIGDRSPYDAADCDIKDLPNIPVIETVLAHYKAGRKIIFCSGREDKYRPETIRFIEKHCRANEIPAPFPTMGPIQYDLFMRKTGDFRKDAIIKEDIYQEHINDKYNVLCVLDDRNQVVEFWRGKGLTCFQVAEGDF